MEFKTTLKNFTLFARLGGNSKTGKGIMISILPKGGLDLETVRSKGSSSCGDCPHATTKAREEKYFKETGKVKEFKINTCYTSKQPGGSQGVLGGINNGFHRCDEISLVKFSAQVQVLAELTGYIRVGEFGDPAADKQTAEVIADILKQIDSSVSRAGYTHQWKKAKAAALKGLVMASCDTIEEDKKAISQGWSTFLVEPRKETNLQGLHCPSQKTGGVVTCAVCGLCNGQGNKTISINLH